jgi:hypothetical protein
MAVLVMMTITLQGDGGAMSILFTSGQVRLIANGQWATTVLDAPYSDSRRLVSVLAIDRCDPAYACVMGRMGGVGAELDCLIPTFRCVGAGAGVAI